MFYIFFKQTLRPRILMTCVGWVMCEGIEEHYQKNSGGGGLEDKLNAAMVIRICNYDGKMEEMLKTDTYRKLKEDSTATPGEWLCYHLLLFLPPLFPTTHPPSCSSSLLPPSPQVRSYPPKLLLTPGRQRAEART